MASVASQLIEEVTAHAQSDSLEDAREICADGTYFPNNLRTMKERNIRYGALSDTLYILNRAEPYNVLRERPMSLRN